MVSESELTKETRTAFTSVQLQILRGFKDALVALFHEVGLPVPHREEEEEEVESSSGSASGHAAPTATIATEVPADSAEPAVS